MKKRTLYIGLILSMAILAAGCQANEEKIEEGTDNVKEVVETVKKDLGEMPKTDKTYKSITKEEFRSLSMDFGIIPLDDDVIDAQGLLSENMAISVLDSKVMDAETEEEFQHAKAEGHKLFRVMYLKVPDEDFESAIRMFTESDEEYDMTDGMLGTNSLTHLSYIEEMDAYSLLTIVDNTIITVESFEKESLETFAKLIGYPYPESVK